MEPIKSSIEDILKATGGKLISKGENEIFSHIRIDSRIVSDKDFFVAIKGETHDGHIFIKNALEAGGAGFLINKAKADKVVSNISSIKKATYISVEDTVKSLGDIARFIREKSKIQIAAITGSNGKTTTREMTAAVLREKFTTLSTKKNFNNQIGLPLTLFEITKEHKWAVVELGINHHDEMTRLGEICVPDIGVILNIGNAHLEGLGSIEGVLKAKSELLQQIKESGVAILNGDDPMLRKAARSYRKKVILFGIFDKKNRKDITASDPEKKDGKISFQLETPDEKEYIKLSVNASFMIYNALAAASVGYTAGLSIREIKNGLEKFIPVKDRMNLITSEKNFTIINDVYNANPDSMKAAFGVLSKIKGKKFAVLGDMLELGKHSEKLHFQIGGHAAKTGISGLFITGDFADHVKQGAIASGFDEKNIITETKSRIAEILNNTLKPKETVLVKGSRGMFMEEIVEKIRN